MSLRARNPLPAGALTVGGGLVIAGVSSYAFLAVAARALGPAATGGSDRYAPLATFWSLLFIIAPGIFLPLEQEVTRAISNRRARGQGGGPAARRAATVGVSALLLLLAGAGAASGAIDSRAFDGNGWLMLALLLGLCAYCAEHLSRGALAGDGRFRGYSILLGSEGIFRVLLCVILARVFHSTDPGAYGIAIVGGSFLAVAVALIPERGLLAAGEPARYAEVTSALGWLLAASLGTQFLANAGPFIVQLLRRPDQAGAAGQFLNGRVIAYVPLFLFQAVQASLLPRLSGLRGSGHHDEFRTTLLRLVGLVAVLGVLTVAGAFALGPWVIHLLFGAGYDLSHTDMGLLAASCTALMLAQSVTQGLIAGSAYWRVTAGWVCGVAGFFLTVLAVGDLFRRVELGLLAGGALAAAVMAVLLLPLLRPAPAKVDG